MNIRTLTAGAAIVAFLTGTQVGTSADSTIKVGRDVIAFGEPPVPIAVSGFSGEVQTVLQFDLHVMGFKLVPESEAQFTVAGSNAGAVEARVKDRLGGGNLLLGKRYTGGSLRQQAHALADDIVKSTVNREGVAQTRIAFRVKTGQRANEIFVADFDGGNAKAATSDNVLVAAPTWVKGRATRSEERRVGKECVP